MKHFYILVLTFFITGLGFGQTTISQQDFETSPQSPVLTFTNSGGSNSTGSGPFPTGDDNFVSGSRGWEANNTTSTITFSAVDISGFSNVSLDFRLASFAGTSGNGNDGADEVLIEISLDGGSTFSDELEIEGNNNAKWSFDTGLGTATSVYDGNNSQTIFTPSGGGNRDTDGYSFVSITSIPSTTQLVIRITMNNNSSNEYWIIDDVSLSGIAASGPANPDTFSASATSSSQIDLTYDDNPDEDNVVIVFDTDNTFTTPAGAPATVGNAFAGGTVLYNSNGSGTYNHTGLTGNTTYYYKAWSYDGADYSSGIGVDATTPCSAITSFPFTEGFEGGVPPSCWTSFRGINNLGTSEDWKSDAESNSGSFAAVVADEDAGAETEDWLVTPALDLSSLTNTELSFFAKSFYAPDYGTLYTVRVSTTSQTNHASFSIVDTFDESDFSASSYNQFIVDLSTYDTQTIYIAFVQTQTYGDAWLLDDIEVAQGKDSDTEVYSGIQPASASLSSLADTEAEAVSVFEIDIEDQGTSDGLATLVTNIRLQPHTTNTADWTDNIQGVTLNDGSAISINSLDITDSYIDVEITSGNLSVADGTTKTITVGLYLNTSNIVDGDVISFLVDADNHGFTADSSGSGFSPDFLLGDFNSNDFTIDVEATELRFTVQPTDVTVSAVMSPDVEITASDSNGNIDLDYSGAGSDISLTTDGTFDGTATTSVSAVSGEAIFGNLIFSDTGTEITLTAASTGLNSDTSIAFDVLTLPSELWSEPFDDNSQYSVTLGGEGNDGNQDYFQITDGSNINYSYSGGSGTFFACQDIDDGGWTGSASPSQLTWNGIDISGFSGLNFKGSFASFGGGIDNADFVLIEYQMDSGGWQDLLAFKNNGTGSNKFFLEDTNFNGTGDGIALSNSFNEFEKNIGTVGLLMDLRITISLNSGSEEIAFDDFSLSGNYSGLVYANSSWNPSAPSAATGSSDVLIMDGTYAVTSDVSLNDVTVNPNANITVDAATTLTVNSLTLESTSSSYSSLILDGSITGTVNYERHVNGNTILGDTNAIGNNDLIAPPLSGQTFGAFASANSNLLENPGDANEKAFAPFDKATGDYVNYFTTTNALTPLDAGVGYRAATDNTSTLTFTGTVNTGTVTNNIVNSGPAFAAWNLVGNPYPSYLKVQDFLNFEVTSGVKNLNLFEGTTAAIYGFDGDTGTNGNSYTIYNLVNTDANTVIAPGQGFLVSADPAVVATYDITFDPAMRATGTNDDFITGRGASTLINLELQIGSASSTFVTDFYFNANAGLGLDPGYDAAFFGSAPAFALYSHLVEENTGIPFTIQALDTMDLDETTVALGVNANQGEQLTFSISETTLPAAINVFLIDALTNTTTLLNSGDYVLTPATNLNGTGRFYLNFKNSALNTTEENFSNINMYTLEKDLMIEGFLLDNTNVKIFDLQGRAILSLPLDTTSQINTINMNPFASGVYIVQLTNNTVVKSQKIVLK